MKLVLLIAALVLLVWLLGGLRRRKPPAAPQASQPSESPAPEPQPMLTCAHCGLHLPRDEALPGRGGVFCGDEHRTAFERANPGS